MALLLLRVSIGWHFYKEGAKKLNSADGFTSAGFLRQAKGPWAESFHNMAREPHDWDLLLAVPRERLPLSAEAQDKIIAWEKENKEALESDSPPIRPHAAYADYAERVSEDWKNDLQKLMDRSQASEAARKEAGQKYAEYRRYLLGYLQEIEGDIANYQHELWRLEGLESSPTANSVPFQKTRIADKQKETAGMVAPWVGQVQDLEVAYLNEAGRVLGKENAVVTLPPANDQLSMVDRIVPYWHVAVGAALILGLFSRLAGAGAALFLIMVLAAQPPWVAEAADTYYQVVELCGCLVLATIPTGRFAGLDFFIHALFSRGGQKV